VASLRVDIRYTWVRVSGASSPCVVLDTFYQHAERGTRQWDRPDDAQRGDFSTWVYDATPRGGRREGCGVRGVLLGGRFG
jgi:hypothetical protein